MTSCVASIIFVHARESKLVTGRTSWKGGSNLSRTSRTSGLSTPEAHDLSRPHEEGKRRSKSVHILRHADSDTLR